MLHDKTQPQHQFGCSPIKTVRLKARRTADGLLEVLDDVPLGRQYLVYAEAQPMDGLHKPTGTLWQRLMYEVVGGGWLPVEMLEDVTPNG
jgi:hypothetical protein